MIDLSEEPVAENITTTAKYLKRAAPMKVSFPRERRYGYLPRRIYGSCLLTKFCPKAMAGDGDRNHWRRGRRTFSCLPLSSPFSSANRTDTQGVNNEDVDNNSLYT